MLHEISLFGIAIGSGIVLAAVFDIGRAFRLRISHKSSWVALEDFLFWVLAGLFLFSLFVKYNKGVLRFYVFAGNGIGVLLYCIFLQRPVFFCFSLFFRLVKAFFGIFKKILGNIKKVVKKMIILPLKNVIKEITIMMNNV